MNENKIYTIVRTTPSDNVGIIPQPGGLIKGTCIENGPELMEDIPMGHKVALQDLPAGAAVIRYGQVIGYTTRDIVQGYCVNESNMEMPEPPALNDIHYQPAPQPELIPLKTTI